MRANRISDILFASFLASAAVLATAPASAQSPYDGLWQVTVVTKTGSCDAQTTSTVNVADGKISGGPVSGSVGSGGLVKVSINGAYANGRIGEMEWRFSWCPVQRSMGSVPSISQAGLLKFSPNRGG